MYKQAKLNLLSQLAAENRIRDMVKVNARHAVAKAESTSPSVLALVA